MQYKVDILSLYMTHGQDAGLELRWTKIRKKPQTTPLPKNPQNTQMFICDIILMYSFIYSVDLNFNNYSLNVTGRLDGLLVQ